MDFLGQAFGEGNASMESSGASFSGGSGEQTTARGNGTGTLSVFGMETTDNGTHSDISMLDEYTLGHLLSFLPVKDLKNCRLVNRSWHQASTRVIVKSENSLVFSGIEGDYGNEDIPKFIHLIQGSSQFPWTRYTVDTEKMDKEQVTNLFRAIVPFVTKLTTVNFSNMDRFPEDVEFPTLCELGLYYNENAHPSEWNRKNVMRALEQAPKLNELTLFGYEMMPTFIALLETQNCQKITKLLIWSRIEAEHLLKLSGLGLKLKYLYLTFLNLSNESIVNVDSLGVFLQSQTRSLEELHLNADTDMEYTQLKLECPRMEKLKVLVVPDPLLYSRISYKTQFPQLKKLVVNETSSELELLESFFNDQVEPVESVKELELEIYDPPSWLILQAARQFPKLCKIALNATLTPDSLNCLGHSMSHLEEICLNDSRRVDLDAILTGFSFQHVKVLKGLPSSLLDVLEESREPVHFLKNLRKLRICGTSSNRWAEELQLSDFGCRFALLKMENLGVLEIKGNFRHKISDQVMERMRKKFVVRFEN